MLLKWKLFFFEFKSFRLHLANGGEKKREGTQVLNCSTFKFELVFDKKTGDYSLNLNISRCNCARCAFNCVLLMETMAVEIKIFKKIEV